MKNLLITLAAIMLVLGCKKERVKYLSDDIKKNYSYKPGSYWIYRDSATGREDSCYVYSNAILFVDNTKYSSRSSSSKYDKEQYINVRMDLVTMIKGRKGSIDIEYRFFNNSLIGLFGNPLDPLSFFGPLNINQQTLNGRDEFLPSISLQGKEFLNTYKIIDESGLYYFNDGVGLIKINNIYDSVAYNWEIVRYNVIK